jgi:hypothetical protein
VTIATRTANGRQTATQAINRARSGFIGPK